MKVILDIKDKKAPALLELLRSLSFVKVKPLSDKKALFLEEFKEAVDELNEIKSGKLKARDAKDFINELSR